MPWDWDKLKQQQQSARGGSPPPVEDVFRKFKEIKLPGGWMAAAVIFLLYFGSSLLYTVGVDEVGLVQRFGKYVRQEGPGLHVKFPRGIERVTKVKVNFVYKEEFGFRTLRADVRSQYSTDKAYDEESLMLTGDLNVAIVPWIVQYRVNDPYKFLFRVHDVRNTLRDLSEAAVRLVVGDRSIDEVLFKREDIAHEAKTLLQKELDRAETGISVNTIELKNTTVPVPVQPSFNEVNQAMQRKEETIYQAREAYNKVVPSAVGNAEKTLRAAEGYSLERVNKAKGDASRFAALYQEYVKSKDVTRRRLYLEALKDVLPKMGKKYILDSNQGKVLPLLQLGKEAQEALK